MPLNDRTRIILFWFTIALMLAVAVLAAVAILRACGGLPSSSEPPLTIAPAEVNLCPGGQQQFVVAGDAEVEWEAGGGTIDDEGVFTAGSNPGDYTVTATRDESGRAAGAIVHVVSCTPTPTSTPLPTLPPTATPEPTATAAPTALPTTSSTDADPEGDIAEYDTGAAIGAPPTGVDIADASVSRSAAISFQPGEDLPADLVGWSEEDEALLWMALHDAIPDPPISYMNWLFVIDVDGNAETGRPVGSRRINPDLGDEVAIGVSYDTNAEAYEPYSLVWDTEQEGWTSGPDVRHTLVTSRTVVGLAFSMSALEEALAEIDAPSLERGSALGRAAAETYLADGTRVIDFYPDLPE